MLKKAKSYREAVRPPFQERKSPLRGVLDIATGSYPAFLFGGTLGHALPVFHFHDVDRDYLEPYFAYLAENRYRTVSADTLAQVARETVVPEPRSVALCFDDAWASMWTVVLPLLEAYDLTAITYVAPARIQDAPVCRPAPGVGGENSTEAVFVTWPELKALHESGRVDVQAHTLSHAMIFCADVLTGLVTPATRMALLSWPQCAAPESGFVTGEMLGYPLFMQRSRMSDAHRFVPDEAVISRSRQWVAEHGGAACFERPDWEREWREALGKLNGRFETDAERDEAIRQELTEGRAQLESKLSKRISQVCMPWAICGRRAEMLAREVGYQSVVADRLFGKRYVYPGANPWRLMRLKHDYIRLLPGKGRRHLLALRQGGAHG